MWALFCTNVILQKLPERAYHGQSFLQSYVTGWVPLENCASTQFLWKPRRDQTLPHRAWNSLMPSSPSSAPSLLLIAFTAFWAHEASQQRNFEDEISFLNKLHFLMDCVLWVLEPVLAFLFGKFPHDCCSHFFPGHTKFCSVSNSGLWLATERRCCIQAEGTYCRSGIFSLLPQNTVQNTEELKRARANYTHTQI